MKGSDSSISGFTNASYATVVKPTPPREGSIHESHVMFTASSGDISKPGSFTKMTSDRPFMDVIRESNHSDDRIVNVPDTKKLIMRYSGTSLESSSGPDRTITPGMSPESSVLNTEHGQFRESLIDYDLADNIQVHQISRQSSELDPEQDRFRDSLINHEIGYNSHINRANFPVASDMSLSSLYGKDTSLYDTIKSDLDPMYIPHAPAEPPLQRRNSLVQGYQI